MQLLRPETRPQFSRCAKSCLQCIVLVLLLGPPLICHDGSWLVSRGSCGFTTGSMRLCINLPSILNAQSSEMGLYDLGLAQVYLALGGPRR